MTYSTVVGLFGCRLKGRVHSGLKKWHLFISKAIQTAVWMHRRKSDEIMSWAELWPCLKKRKTVSITGFKANGSFEMKSDHHRSWLQRSRAQQGACFSLVQLRFRMNSCNALTTEGLRGRLCASPVCIAARVNEGHNDLSEATMVQANGFYHDSTLRSSAAHMYMWNASSEMMCWSFLKE